MFKALQHQTYIKNAKQSIYLIKSDVALNYHLKYKHAEKYKYKHAEKYNFMHSKHHGFPMESPS